MYTSVAQPFTASNLLQEAKAGNRLLAAAPPLHPTNPLAGNLLSLTGAPLQPPPAIAPPAPQPNPPAEVNHALVDDGISLSDLDLCFGSLSGAASFDSSSDDSNKVGATYQGSKQEGL